VAREELLELLAGSLPALVEVLPTTGAADG
jgi:hypothetical protein